MIDAVLSYEMNPLTSGVAKFNQQLARRLGVPFWHLFRTPLSHHPLISIKAEDLGPRWWVYIPLHTHTVLLHDRPAQTPAGVRILYADEAGCPSTLLGNPTRGAYRVLTFGMAHKRLWPHYERLKAQLDAEHPDYTLELSTAVHEGHPWDEGLTECVTRMRAIFGDHLRVLGFLGDDALAKELQDCDAVAVYFDPAFRSNNTSAWAAIDAGKVLYTNVDDRSPSLASDHSWETLIKRLTCESS